MRSVLERVGVRRCTDAEGAPKPIQCGGGVAAACGCGRSPPCHFSITQLKAAAGGLVLTLPGVDRKVQADLITTVLRLAATPPAKGNLGQPHGTRNYPVIGYRLGGETEVDPEGALDRLCNGELAWGYGDGERLQLGAAVARADPRYEGQSEHDTDAGAFFRGHGEHFREEHDEFREVSLPDTSEVNELEQTAEELGMQFEGAEPNVSPLAPYAPYHSPRNEAELTAASQRQWTQKRAMFNAMPAGMPAEEQVRRVSLALDYSAATVDALTTFNDYSERTVAAMLSKLAGVVGHEELGHQLASGILLRAANGARLVGGANAQKSSALIPMMMRVTQRVGVAKVERALRALVAPAASAATAAPVAPNAPTALTAVGDAASPSTATLNAPAVPAAYAETASSSTAAPAASDSNGWMCMACNAQNSNSHDVCTTKVSGWQCNSTRALGFAVGGKRTRTATPRSSGVAGGGVQGNTASGRGKGRAAAATPALRPPAVLAPLPEDAPLASVAARKAKETALAEIGEKLVGDMADVKKTVTELCDSVIHGLMVREQTGAEPQSANNHMLFLGNPGTGKTTVAEILARLLKGLGVVATTKVCVHDNARTALVDGNLGCTAGKAAKVITKAIGGVLFLDEARRPSRIARRTLTRTRTRRPHAHRLTRSCPGPAATTTRKRPLTCSSRNRRSTVATRSSSSRGIATK
jgi:hypothetical protein